MKKRVISLFLALLLLVGMLPTIGAAEEPLTVVVSMEGLTLGQGFYAEPKAYTLGEINDLVKTAYPEGFTKDTLTAGIATYAFLLDHGFEYQMTGSWDSDAYLSGIKGIDKGTVNIPEVIASQEGAPSNSENEGNDDEYLGEFDYGMMSGWMITVNDFMIDKGCGSWTLTGSEDAAKYVSNPGNNTYVIRWQFTLWGYGADLGVDLSSWGMPALFNGANKAPLYAAYAKSEDSEKKAAALPVMTNLTASQEDVDSALAAFKTVVKTAAETVIEQIAAIGTVTLDSESAISAARAAYDALTNDQQALVTNYETLTAAENTLAALKTVPAGEGTEEHPYLLKTAANLVWVSDAVKGGNKFNSAYFRIENDITLPDNWFPIGGLKTGATGYTYNKSALTAQIFPFNGIIDGGEHTITVPGGSLPLLGGGSFTVKDLKIYGEKIPSYGLAAYYRTGHTVNIENVTILSGSHILKSGLLGGYGNNGESVIRNCTVESGVVIGDDGSWGRFGYDGTKELTFNFGPTGVTENDMIGSIVGAFNGTVTGCTSAATVYGHNYVGGIYGFKGQSMRDCIVNDCVFTGSVIATGEGVGGILGTGYVASSAPNTPCATVENCLVTGSVTGADKVGGIFGGELGSCVNWGNGIGRVRNNVFNGTVSATAQDGIVGGIVGYMNSFDIYNIISGNYYINTVSKGIGKLNDIILRDETDKGMKYGRLDKPTDEATLNTYTTAVSAAELADGTVLALLKANKVGNSWVAGATTPVINPQTHITGVVGKTYTSAIFESNPPIEVKDDYSALAGKSALVSYSDGRTLVPVNATGFYGVEFNLEGIQLCSFDIENYQFSFGVSVQKSTAVQEVLQNIDEAISSGAEEIVVTGSTDESGKEAVVLPVNVVSKAANESTAALRVNTNAGSLVIPNDTLGKIAEAAGGEGVAINMEAVASETIASRLPGVDNLENAAAVEVTITSGDATISSFGGKKLNVQIPVNTEVFKDGKTYAAFIVSGDGSVDKTVATIEGDKAVVSTGHFSTVIVTSQEKSVNVKVTVNVAPSTVNVTFFKDSSAGAQLADTAVEDKGTVKVGSVNFHQYILTVAPGTYSYRGLDGETVLGGEQFTVTEDETQTLNLLRVNIRYNSSVLNQPDDYTFTLKNGANDVTVGEVYLSSNVRYTPTLLIAGVKHDGVVALAEKNQEDYYVTGDGVFSNTPSKTTGNAATVNLPVSQYKIIRVKAPADANATFYQQNKNYNVSVVTPDKTTTADSITTYLFKGTSAHSNYMYRVTKAGKVTQAGYMVDGNEYTVTFPEDRTPADTDSTLEYDDNSVLLNINSQNKLSLSVGETFKLRAYRAPWQIVNTTSGNIMIEPDFHYAILSGSDVIDVAPITDSCTGNASGNWMNITAKKAGTALVAVYYDAIDVYGANPCNASGISTFGAADPARYGVFTVCVGDTGSVTWNPQSESGSWDAEFDTVSYMGESGVFSFKPSGTVTAVSVQNVLGTTPGAVQTVTAQDGAYNVPVTEGANVITVTTAAGTDTLVVRAKEVRVRIKNNTTNKTDADEGFEIHQGDSITVSFDHVNMPIPKFSGIYNPGFPKTIFTKYILNDEYDLLSGGTQYNYPVEAGHALTFKAELVGENRLTHGTTNLTNMGSAFGEHRKLTDAGVPANLNAAESAPTNFGTLPDVTFTVLENGGSQPSGDLSKMKSLSLYVGASTYMVGIDKVITDTKGNVVTTWKSQANGTMGLHAAVTLESYLCKAQLRYWYEGEEPRTVALTSGVETVLSGDAFTTNANKLLNIQIIVTPPAGMGEAKTYNYVVLGGTANQKYIHPLIKTLTVTSGENKLALEPAIDCINTDYTLNVGSAEKISLAGVQQINIYNTSTAADMSDEISLSLLKKGVAVGESITVLASGQPNNPNRNWTYSDLDITGADTLRITVKSYADESISRVYNIALLGDEKKPYESYDMKLTFDSKDNVAVGSTVTATVTLSNENAEPIDGYQLELKTEGLQFVRAEMPSGILKFNAAGGISCGFDKTEGYAISEDSTVIAKLTFTVTDASASLSAENVKIACHNADEADFNPECTVTGDSLSALSVELISFKDFGVGKAGYQLAIVGTDKPVSGTYAIGGNDMLWSPDYEAYVLLVPDTMTAADVAAAITPSENEAVSIYGLRGDVTLNSTVDIFDAQLVLNALHQRTNIPISDRQYFEMDVDNTKAVDIDDVQWILEEIVGLHND